MKTQVRTLKVYCTRRSTNARKASVQTDTTWCIMDMRFTRDTPVEAMYMYYNCNLSWLDMRYRQCLISNNIIFLQRLLLYLISLLLRPLIVCIFLSLIVTFSKYTQFLEDTKNGDNKVCHGKWWPNSRAREQVCNGLNDEETILAY